MPTIGFEHTADGHVGIADRLDLLQSVSGNDIVERGKILIEKIDEQRRLYLFGEKRKTLKIGEKYRRRVDVSWLDLAVPLELLCD
jgi:hypothetical protein